MTVRVPDVSVVICAYSEDRWRDLIAAVDSVRVQTIPAREIILVIDHNTRLLERARTQIPGVVLVENREERGLSGARNSGAAAANSTVIAFLDDDALAAPDWLSRLTEHYKDQQVLGVGGAIAPLWAGGRPDWFPDEFDWVVGCSYRGMPRVTAPVRNLIGANMSFRREVMEVTGGFRSGIGRVGEHPVGCEETELCIRARRSWPERVFLYEPRAQVHHRVPASRARWSYFRRRCYAEGLSKALVSRLVGNADGLASERTYTFRTLPQGVARSTAEALLGRHPARLARSGSIVAGLAITTAGYLVGKASTARERRSVSSAAAG